MDDVPAICPPWWPEMIWQLHRPDFVVHLPGRGPGPVNIPVAIQDISAALLVHTSTYLLMNQERAQAIRDIAEQQIADTATNLSKLHDEAVQQRSTAAEQA